MRKDGTLLCPFLPPCSDHFSHPQSADIKAAEMAARAATFTYYPDVDEAQGPPADCLERQARGGPICQREDAMTRQSLNKLFHATNGYWWKSNANWRTNVNYCSWASLSCDERGVLRGM